MKWRRDLGGKGESCSLIGCSSLPPEETTPFMVRGAARARFPGLVAQHVEEETPGAPRGNAYRSLIHAGEGVREVGSGPDLDWTGSEVLGWVLALRRHVRSCRPAAGKQKCCPKFGSSSDPARSSVGRLGSALRPEPGGSAEGSADCLPRTTRESRFRFTELQSRNGTKTIRGVNLLVLKFCQGRYQGSGFRGPGPPSLLRWCHFIMKPDRLFCKFCRTWAIIYHLETTRGLFLQNMFWSSLISS